MKKVFSWVAGFLGLLLVLGFSGAIGEFVGQWASSNYSKGRQEGFIAQTQRDLAKQLNAQLPMRVDEQTVLISVASADTTVFYNYRIELSDSEIDVPSFSRNMLNHLKSSICGNEKMLWALKSGARYAYSYTSNDGSNLATHAVSIEDCSN